MRFDKNVSLVSLVLFTILCCFSQASAQNEPKAPEPDPRTSSDVSKMKIQLCFIQATPRMTRVAFPIGPWLDEFRPTDISKICVKLMTSRGRGVKHF